MKNAIIVMILVCVGAAPATVPTTAATKPALKPGELRLRADAPPEVKALVHNVTDGNDKLRKRREVAIKTASELLSRYQIGLVDPKTTRPREFKRLTPDSQPMWFFRSEGEQLKAIAEQQKIIETAEAELAQSKGQLLAIPSSFDRSELEKGTILTFGSIRVEQVIDETTARLKVRYGSDLNLSTDIWVAKMNTANLTDEASISGMTIWITGTKTYGTAVGSQRTIMAGERFDIQDWLEH